MVDASIGEAVGEYFQGSEYQVQGLGSLGLRVQRFRFSI